MKACPFCAEEIQDAAIYCKHCHKDLVPAAPAPVPLFPSSTQEAKPAASKPLFPPSTHEVKPPRKRWPWVLGTLALFFGLFYMWATSSHSVNLDESRALVRSLERDKVLTGFDCPTAKISPAAWQQLATERLKRNLLLALSRVCIAEVRDPRILLMDVTSGSLLATFDGSSMER